MKLPIFLCAALLLSACLRTPEKRTLYSLTPPTPDAMQVTEFPGLHNVVSYAPGLYSGAQPEGQEGFESLRALGVRTVISVDGALPDLKAAHAEGLRYVHLPIGYNGVPEERALQLAKAIETLPGPIYVHCHHGKHRSAGALATAGVMTGKFDNAFAVARMKVSGTAPAYTGLYASAEQATRLAPELIAKQPADFPEQSKPSGMVSGMVSIDELNDQLKAVEKAGWKTPADSPDLVPVSIARQLVEQFDGLLPDACTVREGPNFSGMLTDSSAKSQAIREGLEQGLAAAELTERMKALQASCKACHKQYRD